PSPCTAVAARTRPPSATGSEPTGLSGTTPHRSTPTSRTQRARFSQGGRNTESERSRASARWGSRPESLWDIAMARVLRVQPLEVAGVRDQFNRFVERHGVAWELAMALLAIVYVAVGFAL